MDENYLKVIIRLANGIVTRLLVCQKSCDLSFVKLCRKQEPNSQTERAEYSTEGQNKHFLYGLSSQLTGALLYTCRNKPIQDKVDVI